VPPFRRVESKQAGPRALGILVPPGLRTLVILRPRGLPWDLLPARWTGDPARPPEFCAFGRDEAAGVARRLQKALERAVELASNPLQTIADARGQCHQVWLCAEEYVWVVCHRAPGQSYQPAVFADRDEALRNADQLVRVFWPTPDAEQEYYFNTQHFA
jgi:hypothetical protein